MADPSPRKLQVRELTIDLTDILDNEEANTTISVMLQQAGLRRDDLLYSVVDYHNREEILRAGLDPTRTVRILGNPPRSVRFQADEIGRYIGASTWPLVFYGGSGDGDCLHARFTDIAQRGGQPGIAVYDRESFGNLAKYGLEGVYECMIKNPRLALKGLVKVIGGNDPIIE